MECISVYIASATDPLIAGRSFQESSLLALAISFKVLLIPQILSLGYRVFSSTIVKAASSVLAPLTIDCT